MKKLSFLLLMFLSVTALSFAENAQVPATKPAVTSTTPAPAVIIKSLSGTVDSVRIGDAASGTQSEIVIVAADGQKLNLVVKAGTSITDKDAKALTLSDIKKDSKVAVEYTKKASGTNKAQSIKLVE